MNINKQEAQTKRTTKANKTNQRKEGEQEQVVQLFSGRVKWTGGLDTLGLHK